MCSVCLHPKLRFYHHVGAKHGHLRVIVQRHALDQHVEVWRNATQALQGVWWRTVIWIPSNHSFQVWNSCFVTEIRLKTKRL